MLKNSPFKIPKLKVYIGKIKFYTPYFEPRGFHRSLISFRRLKLRSERDYENYITQYTHLKGTDKAKYSNLPMVRRNKSKILFNCLLVSWGSPIKFHKVHLGWKEKFGSIQYEWSPSCQFWFFKWQIVFYYEVVNPEKFWEMYLWWKYYSDCDIEKAEKTWGWVDAETGISTWDRTMLKDC